MTLKKHLWSVIVSVLAGCTLWAMAAGEETKGTVVDMGFGQFTLQDKAGTSWKFYMSKEGSAYSPDDWRPNVGDEISVAHISVQKRNAMIAQVTKATLVKAGPNTLRIKSPVEVQITEAGRSGYKAKLAGTDTVVKFSNQRGMQILPTGWAPSAGDKAVVTFTAKTGMGFSIVYAIDKIEKAGAATK